ncbi:MAG: exodeoxyribonuclease VII large subunit [Betaproteobacteria bacterium]|nr:exodeoxyribonuclease VII large subunit [Betaproteobacteria bacterium]
MSSLMPKPAPGAVIGVSALNRMVRDMLEHALPLMWIRGEVSNFTCAASGHCYFTLKDAGAQVRCTMFRSRARLLDWQPGNGMQIEVRALATLFEPRGEFQLNVEAVRRSGMGALYEAFERLKTRLAAEGLFDNERKRPLPEYPRRVGIVTSPQAAALRDVLSILRKRMPALPVIVYPAPVQGAGAAQYIARAIETASRRLECDVLIVCRGGGSIEDLWSFNEEVVARAIHACALPVVSAVGHETDFTIADFVADLRAPTPTAAAQAVSPDRQQMLLRVADVRRHLVRCFARNLDRLWQSLDYLGRRLIDPRERVRIECRHLEHLASRLAHAGSRSLAAERWQLADLRQRLSAACLDPQRHWSLLQHLRVRFHSACRHRLQARQAAVEALGARLRALDPHAVLSRGYAIATDQRGRIVADAAAVAAGELLNVRVARGLIESRVTGAKGVPPEDDGPAGS